MRGTDNLTDVKDWASRGKKQEGVIKPHLEQYLDRLVAEGVDKVTIIAHSLAGGFVPSILNNIGPRFSGRIMIDVVLINGPGTVEFMDAYSPANFDGINITYILGEGDWVGTSGKFPAGVSVIVIPTSILHGENSHLIESLLHALDRIGKMPPVLSGEDARVYLLTHRQIPRQIEHVVISPLSFGAEKLDELSVHTMHLSGYLHATYYYMLHPLETGQKALDEKIEKMTPENFPYLKLEQDFTQVRTELNKQEQIYRAGKTLTSDEKIVRDKRLETAMLALTFARLVKLHLPELPTEQQAVVRLDMDNRRIAALVENPEIIKSILFTDAFVLPEEQTPAPLPERPAGATAELATKKDMQDFIDLATTKRGELVSDKDTLRAELDAVIEGMATSTEQVREIAERNIFQTYRALLKKKYAAEATIYWLEKKGKNNKKLADAKAKLDTIEKIKLLDLTEKLESADDKLQSAKNTRDSLEREAFLKQTAIAQLQWGIKTFNVSIVIVEGMVTGFQEFSPIYKNELPDIQAIIDEAKKPVEIEPLATSTDSTDLVSFEDVQLLLEDAEGRIPALRTARDDANLKVDDAEVALKNPQKVLDAVIASLAPNAKNKKLLRDLAAADQALMMALGEQADAGLRIMSLEARQSTASNPQKLAQKLARAHTRLGNAGTGVTDARTAITDIEQGLTPFFTKQTDAQPKIDGARTALQQKQLELHAALLASFDATMLLEDMKSKRAMLEGIKERIKDGRRVYREDLPDVNESPLESADDTADVPCAADSDQCFDPVAASQDYPHTTDDVFIDPALSAYDINDTDWAAYFEEIKKQVALAEQDMDHSRDRRKEAETLLDTVEGFARARYAWETASPQLQAEIDAKQTALDAARLARPTLSARYQQIDGQTHAAWQAYAALDDQTKDAWQRYQNASKKNKDARYAEWNALKTTREGAEARHQQLKFERAAVEQEQNTLERTIDRLKDEITASQQNLASARRVFEKAQTEFAQAEKNSDVPSMILLTDSLVQNSWDAFYRADETMRQVADDLVFLKNNKTEENMGIVAFETGSYYTGLVNRVSNVQTNAADATTRLCLVASYASIPAGQLKTACPAH
jgi:hypothetical protein